MLLNPNPAQNTRMPTHSFLYWNTASCFMQPPLFGYKALSECPLPYTIVQHLADQVSPTYQITFKQTTFKKNHLVTHSQRQLFFTIQTILCTISLIGIVFITMLRKKVNTIMFITMYFGYFQPLGELTGNIPFK